jgi:hypothetical protein
MAHPASCTMGNGVLSLGVKRVRGVTLTTHPHLMPRSWMSRSCNSSPLHLHTCVVGLLYKSPMTALPWRFIIFWHKDQNSLMTNDHHTMVMFITAHMFINIFAQSPKSLNSKQWPTNTAYCNWVCSPNPSPRIGDQTLVDTHRLFFATYT